MKQSNTQRKVIQKKVKNLRKWVADEIKRVNRKRGLSKISNSPKFSYKIDARTHKIILCYTISVPDATKKKGYKRVHKQKYHKHLTLEDYKLGLDVLEDYEYVIAENDEAISSLSFNDERSLIFWIEKYCSPIPRRGLTDIPNPTNTGILAIFFIEATLSLSPSANWVRNPVVPVREM